MIRQSWSVKSLLTAMFAMGTVASAHAATQATPGSVQPSVAPGYSAAPDVSVHVAPPVSHHCGLFQTCADTKIGLGRGDFLVKFQAMGLITNSTNSSVNIDEASHNITAGDLLGAGVPATPQAVAALGNGSITANTSVHDLLKGNQGNVSLTNAVMPGFTFQYFVTDHISLDAIASSMRIEGSARNTSLGRLGGIGANATNTFWPGSTSQSGKVDLGSMWVLPPTVTAAWHFRPHKRFNPYAGVGLMLAFFYDEHPAGGNCNSYNSMKCGPINRMKAQTTPGVAFDFGFDYQVVGNWFFNFDAKQALLHVPVFLNGKGGNYGSNGASLSNITGVNGLTGRIHAQDSVNPTVLAMGLGYRF